MKKVLSILALAALVISVASCSKSRAEQMAMAENVKVQCTPDVLEIVGGNIPVTVTVTYPENYFEKKATMEVTPVLVYEGGEQAAPVCKYQGESIKDNNKVVPFAGGTVTEKLNFNYVKGCEKAYLELRSVAYYKGQPIEIPTVKVADGCIATYQLATLKGVTSCKADGYQAVITSTTEGRILYDVNSANVKNSELNGESIKAFKSALKALEENDRVTVKGTKIIAYASPEGGQKLNAKLSDNRAGTAEKAWKKISKGLEAGTPAVESIGQDWNGFQEAITNSNIQSQDKELILRVLSMYSDPAVRESEIRNMSQVYTEINKTVFPELRRARFVTESDFRNYSDEELKAMAEKGLLGLDEPSILHLATIAANDDDKENLYKAAINQYDSDVARFNLAQLYLKQDKVNLAGAFLSKIKNIDGDALNAAGVVALRSGNMDEAVKCFKNAETEQANENLAVIDIINGNYAAAAAKLAGKTGNNAAVANILNGDLAAAEKALTCKCAAADYLRAVVAARKGEVSAAKKYLEAATSKCDCLKERAAKDIEFAAL